MLNLGPSPLYSRREIAADSPRNILLYSLWVVGVVLSQGDETRRLFEFLRRTFPCSGGGLNLLRVPVRSNVNNWAARTPEGFTFAVKIPQSISHEKVLVGCDAELAEFLKTMDVLGAKLGPVVLQFPFFNKSAFQDRHEFLDRLVPFLTKLPTGYKFALEIRNRNWLDAEFANLLRDRSIALVLQDRSWMPSPSELKFDPITASWTYIRWLGDRKAIEQESMTWDKTVIDRSAELSSWVDFCYQVRKRGVLIYAFANNHFSGHSPATIEQFRSIWQSKGFPPIDEPRPSQRQPSLFSA